MNFTFKALYKKDTVDGELEPPLRDKKICLPRRRNYYSLENPLIKTRLFGFAFHMERMTASEFDFQSTCLLVVDNQKLWKDDTELALRYSIGPGYSFADLLLLDVDGNDLNNRIKNGVVVRVLFALYAYSPFRKLHKFTSIFFFITKVVQLTYLLKHVSRRPVLWSGQNCRWVCQWKLHLKFDHNSDVTGDRGQPTKYWNFSYLVFTFLLNTRTLIVT